VGQVNALRTLKDLRTLGQDIPSAVLIAAIEQLARKDRQMAKTIAEAKTEFQAALDAVIAKTAAQGTTIGSMKALLEGLVAQNAALKVQLQEAIASGGDASTLQPILDALNAQDEAIQANTDAIAAAVTANTPNAVQG
jgi:hypothetical protein